MKFPKIKPFNVLTHSVTIFYVLILLPSVYFENKLGIIFLSHDYLHLFITILCSFALIFSGMEILLFIVEKSDPALAQIRAQEKEQQARQLIAAKTEPELYPQWQEMYKYAIEEEIYFNTYYDSESDFFGKLIKEYDQQKSFDPIYVKRIFLLYEKIYQDLKTRELKDVKSNAKLKETLKRISTELVARYKEYEQVEALQFDSTLNAINNFIDLRLRKPVER